jgi:hypothetical protein
MIMLNDWQVEYQRLTDFVTRKPQVKISENVIAIPKDARSEFYQLFDMVRMAFIEEKLSDLFNEAATLSENYTKADQEVTELLVLDDILMTTGLRSFLRNPRDGLMMRLLDPLFDLLKGKINAKTFEQEVSRNMETSLRDSYRLGYKKWLALSLVKLLEADRSLEVSVPSIYLGPARGERGYSPSDEKHPVPPPKESKHLSFKHEQSSTLTVPDFIVHSAKINRYFALRSEFRTAAAVWTASNASEHREWYPLDHVVALRLDSTLIYVADNPEEISLVADAKKICRPDLIIEFIEQKDRYEKEELEKVKLHHNVFKPRLGTYIVTREQVPDVGQLGDGIHILTVGFDQSKLEPIISSLMKQEDEDQ